MGSYVTQDPEGSQVPQSPMGSLCNPGTPRVHRHLSHLQGPYVTQEPPRVHRHLSHLLLFPWQHPWSGVPSEAVGVLRSYMLLHIYNLSPAITDSMDLSLSKLLELVMDRRPGVLQSLGLQSQT